MCGVVGQNLAKKESVMMSQFLNYLLGGERACIRNLLAGKKVKSVILSELENGSFFLEHFNKIIAGGRIEVVGGVKELNNRYEYFPPKSVVVYLLHEQCDGASGCTTFYLFRTSKGKEIFVKLNNFCVRKIHAANLPGNVWREFRDVIKAYSIRIPMPISTELKKDKRFLFQDDSTDGD